MKQDRSNLEKATARTAQVICRDLPLSPAARQLLHPDDSLTKFLSSLESVALFDDALLFLAGSLPRREAIWWTCLCVWQLYGPRLSVADRDMLQAASRWVLEPTPGNTQKAETLGEKGDFRNPAAWPARVAAWKDHSASDGAFNRAAKMLAGAVSLAIKYGDHRQISANMQRCLWMGMEVVRGKSEFA